MKVISFSSLQIFLTRYNVLLRPTNHLIFAKKTEKYATAMVTFHQDGGPIHRACETVIFLEAVTVTPHFIPPKTPKFWSPNSRTSTWWITDLGGQAISSLRVSTVKCQDQIQGRPRTSYDKVLWTNGISRSALQRQSRWRVTKDLQLVWSQEEDSLTLKYVNISHCWRFVMYWCVIIEGWTRLWLFAGFKMRVICYKLQCVRLTAFQLRFTIIF